ncbi:hypothetical protein SCB71_06330 [Herbiconiux sp. KACC 21604]|uniref:hypothetical protein n=1 Tax=unclassified Herbiconiux TaxID=2618217 RepID=UPI001490AAEF|nr:hypothetical protein [Herbiconiux sp. SALV-R1]QJU52935.1 hypothetical protein HL652_04315 [Herbiconiux sp. SALV-R1]WPO87855.1 hypothetical protein SCB71_06330 [Herbiconiux sp. KACC 21604]
MTAVVSVPLVIAKQEDGSDVYLYQGASVGDGLAKGELKRLRDGGFISEVEDVVEEPAPEPVEIPEGDPTMQWNVAQIDAFAEKRGIDLTGPNTKPEKLEVIAAELKKAADAAGK